MVRTTLTGLAVAVMLAPAALAADDDKLTIGDAAPDIDIAHWLKGEPVEDFEDGNVYVLEFWATWCGPCVASMPHVSELQEKYKDYDVTFIGVSDEPLQTVVEFLFKTYPADNKIHHERTHYTLTTDPDESVKKDYFKAAGQRGIPCAFIIGKDQHVEWIGHPMKIDDALDAVVRDAWDRDEFREKFEAARASEGVADQHFATLRAATQNEDWQAWLSAMDELIALGPEYAGYKAQKFMILAQKVGDYDQAYVYAAEVVKDSWDNPMMLNQVSWFIVDEPGLEERDLDLAMKAAMRGSELTEHKDGAILDTVARCFYEQGNLMSAVEWQRKAVEHGQAEMAEDLKATLEKYLKEVN